MWQPIETAPKDGARIILSDYVIVRQGYWVDQLNDAPDQPGHCAGFIDCECQYFWPGCSIDGDGERQPTHWAPLPPPPQEGV